MIDALRVIWSFRRFFGYAALLVVIGWLWLSNSSLEKTVLRQTVENNKLIADIATQNKTIADFDRASQQRKAAAKEEMKKARVVEKAHTQKANRILVEVPTNSDECVAALDLLRKYQ